MQEFFRFFARVYEKKFLRYNKYKSGKGGVLLRRWLLLLALGLIAAGIWRGEQRAVLAKAARICMECVGLG